MADEEIYESMVQRKGWAYRQDQIEKHSLYNTPIDQSPGRLAGNSHIHGDASPEVQSRVVDELIKASQRGGLNAHETAYVLAIARTESGFNPDAAAGTTSAYGLGQFVKDTGAAYGIDATNRGDVTKQAEALVAHYKDNASIARSRGQSEEYIYKYHHDGPSGEYGGLAISKQDIMPYVSKYESFVAEHQKKHGVAPEDPSFDARNHSAPVASRAHAANVLKQGAHSDAVAELQSQLNQLGYTDRHGHALSEDKQFGADTKAAVEAFQRDRGLSADGVVGPDTQKALKAQVESLGQSEQQPQLMWRLDDPGHPDHSLFRQAQDHIHRLDKELGRTPDQMSNNLASALTVQARADGLQRIDQVALATDGSRLWAVQTPPGRTDHLFDQRTSVPTAEAHTPMDQSGAQWPQAMQQFQQQQEQARQQQQEVQQQAQQSQGMDALHR